MNYPEAIAQLQALQAFGARPGLDTSRRLAAMAGNPESRLRFIHVAGTNGKGSVCAMLHAIYQKAGFKVGLYTSPHLVSFRERIQVNRQLISEADVTRLAGEALEWTKQLPAEQPATFFEVVTIMALCHFAEQHCDIVLWETGLGGRLDATNIVTPLASVITNIGHDHQQWLGNTLAEIAFEKAGIIKRGVPVITAVDQPEALAVIAETAARKESPLIRINPADAIASFPADWELSLAGEHQKLNATIALAVADTLRTALQVTLDQAKAGLSNVQWPGRFQAWTTPDGRRFVLDGAHNPEGIGALCDTLKNCCAGSHLALITGMLADKDTSQMIAMLCPLFERVRVVPVASNRTAATELLRVQFIANGASDVAACESLAEAFAQTQGSDVTVIAGSLYLIGEAMERLGISPCPGIDERALNEFTVPAP